MTIESWRYANCPCKGKEHHPTWVSSDASDGFLPDCQETALVPDTRLQAIADAAKCRHGRIDRHKYRLICYHVTKGACRESGRCWCEGAPKLRALLKDLAEENRR